MIKKSLIAILTFCMFIIIASPVFASNLVNDAGNTLNNIKDGAQNMVRDAGNSLEKAGDSIGNMARDGMNAVHEGAKDLGDGAANMAGSVNEETSRTDRGAGDYTASRTSLTDTATSGNEAIMWTILAVIALVIIGLVWYYGVQTQGNNRDNY